MARIQYAPAAPSRLNCVSALQGIETTRAFRHEFRKGQTIYEVEIEERQTSIYIGDYELLRTRGAEGGPYLDFYIDRSRRYWTEEPMGTLEVLFGGTVRLVSRCE